MVWGYQVDPPWSHMDPINVNKIRMLHSGRRAQLSRQGVHATRLPPDQSGPGCLESGRHALLVAEKKAEDPEVVVLEMVEERIVREAAA